MEQIDVQKKMAGKKAVDYIKDGMTIGLGSGSTVYWMMKRLGELVKEGLDIKGIPSSLRTEGWAKQFGVPLTDFSNTQQLDLAIDGADEVDPQFNLIKGGGGSLVREKIVNTASKKLIIIIDESKLVDQLGAFSLPVEVVQFGYEATALQISKLGCEPVLRMNGKEPFVSNNGNFILDCPFRVINHPEQLNDDIKSVVGVVETGLFLGMTDLVIVGKDACVEVLENS
ncbi:ribose-5-phosphate isomerase RpiA [Halalkalibacter alkalisediminis]|uniref:Ribose-5-phosphate isomerase A n=1 Tax=Halalkalibacter alkalisediminis TaxID=935616 RepID=A0ABV6NHZ2_9BACI|nr:ribose-5-phosphate isomerase RpiA [Halalkalibacter alkalisediminis]